MAQAIELRLIAMALSAVDAALYERALLTWHTSSDGNDRFEHVHRRWLQDRLS
jgi:hypothetical protein